MSTILRMTKSQIRNKYKRLRKTLSDDFIKNQSLLLANLLIEAPIWDKKTFHIFLPIEKQKELDTTLLLPLLQGKDKDIVLPKMNDFNQIQHFLLTDQTVLKINFLGIPEPVSGIEILPTSLDVVFVPLLAFDSKGHRVGYGKGYYDRFLAECRTDCIKVGLSLFEEEKETFIIEETDIALNYCVTPKQVYNY